MENLGQVHYMGVHVMFSPQISYNIVVLSVFSSLICSKDQC